MAFSSTRWGSKAFFPAIGSFCVPPCAGVYHMLEWKVKNEFPLGPIPNNRRCGRIASQGVCGRTDAHTYGRPDPGAQSRRLGRADTRPDVEAWYDGVAGRRAARGPR